MSIEIVRRSFTDVEIRNMVNRGEEVVETPHLGVNFEGASSDQIGTVTGDLASRLVVVDAVSAKTDSFGAVRDWKGQGLFTKKFAGLAFDTTNMHLAGIGEGQIGTNAWQTLQACKNEDGETYNMLKFRLAVLSAVARGKQIQTFQDHWSKSCEAADAIQSVIAKEGGFRRLYEGRKVVDIKKSSLNQIELLNEKGMYYDERGGGMGSGLLPTTESLFAIFAVNAVLSGRDSTFFHLCSASRKYADSSFMDRVQNLVGATLAELGCTALSELILIKRTDRDSGGREDIYAMVEGLAA